MSVKQTVMGDELPLTLIPVKCLKCGHSWFYSKAQPKYRIRCPMCSSAKNDLNRKLFGVWRP